MSLMQHGVPIEHSIAPLAHQPSSLRGAAHPSWQLSALPARRAWQHQRSQQQHSGRSHWHQHAVASACLSAGGGGRIAALTSGSSSGSPEPCAVGECRRHAGGPFAARQHHRNAANILITAAATASCGSGSSSSQTSGGRSLLQRRQGVQSLEAARLAGAAPSRQQRRLLSACAANGSSNGSSSNGRRGPAGNNGGGGNGTPPSAPPLPQQPGNGSQPAGGDGGASQAGRLRSLMQNFGIMGGAGGLAQGFAANVATGGNGNGNGKGAGAGRPSAPGSQQQDGSGWASDSEGGWGAPSPRRTAGNGSFLARARALGGGGGGAAAAARAGLSAQAVAGEAQARRKLSASEVTEWGADWTEDWDPEEDLDREAREKLAMEAEADQRLRESGRGTTPRDKWITPLLDFKAVTGAVDPDQERTEDTLQGEALANKDESQVAIRYVVQLVVVPLVTGFVLSRALADPVLSFTLQNNSEAFAMTDRQKIEGAEKVHIEEARLRFDMAIGKLPPLSEDQILEHLREFAEEVQEEERLANEQNLITVVSDSISSIVLFSIISQQSRGRQALFNTLARLFDGLSDIAKAVMIILIADTLLGYHSEEGWTGLIELIVGHYGFEAEEEGLVIFVGVVPVVIDVFFKYWIFIGLNRISPGAVITLKQIDTH